jgi:hypothetical protein
MYRKVYYGLYNDNKTSFVIASAIMNLEQVALFSKIYGNLEGKIRDVPILTTQELNDLLGFSNQKNQKNKVINLIKDIIRDELQTDTRRRKTATVS